MSNKIPNMIQVICDQEPLIAIDRRSKIKTQPAARYVTPRKAWANRARKTESYRCTLCASTSHIPAA